MEVIKVVFAICIINRPKLNVFILYTGSSNAVKIILSFLYH